MAKAAKDKLGARIIKKAKEFGACSAGIANVEALTSSPSHLTYEKMENYQGVGTKKTRPQKPSFAWPEDVKSCIIVAVEHPEEKPELDWWRDGYKGGTPGNRILMTINDRLSDWLEAETRVRTMKLPYHIEHGGIFLKDAAVLGGLGCLGKNNMLLTPGFGPRVRLRSMFVAEELPPTGPTGFDPCRGCPMPCVKACPQRAFQQKIYMEKDFGTDRLPARTGIYSRNRCNVQMVRDADNSETVKSEDPVATGRLIRFCRLCEQACPVGRPG